MEPELAILMANLAMGSTCTPPPDVSRETFQNISQSTSQDIPSQNFSSCTLSRPYRVLDPFCGCGTLLLAVAYQYQQQQQQQQQTTTDIPNSLSTHPLMRSLQLLGADADPFLVGTDR